MTFSRTVNSVIVDYSSYICAWSKQPKGNGHWAFYFGRDTSKAEPHFYNGTLAACTRQAVQEAKAAGFDLIHVGS